jgi:hypothetical protein
MRNALAVIGTLVLFALMVTDPYLLTWGLIIVAVVMGTASWSQRFKKP